MYSFIWRGHSDWFVRWQAILRPPGLVMTCSLVSVSRCENSCLRIWELVSDNLILMISMQVQLSYPPECSEFYEMGLNVLISMECVWMFWIWLNVHAIMSWWNKDGSTLNLAYPGAQTGHLEDARLQPCQNKPTSCSVASSCTIRELNSGDCVLVCECVCVCVWVRACVCTRV